MNSKLARVVAAAKQVFNNAAPYTPEQLDHVVNTIANISAEELGFDKCRLEHLTHSKQVQYEKIVDTDTLSMGVFLLPPGSRIPLHDHQGMYGIAKCVYGRLRCRSFSKIGSPAGLSPNIVTVTQIHDMVSTEHHPACIVTPDEGNYHEMIAEPCGAAFIDILAPPYDYKSGTRVCHFYREVHLPPALFQTAGGAITPCLPENHVFLVEVTEPPDFNCDPVSNTTDATPV